MSNNDDKYRFEPTAFDYVNPKAEVVIVGITPGNSNNKKFGGFKNS
jgi:G:T/U-mismatch repair DNA glycosylase